MKEVLSTLFNLGYLCGKSDDEKTNNLQQALKEICDKNPKSVYSMVYRKGIEEGVKDRSHLRLDELEQIEKSNEQDLER